jgi:hypothetical protein
VGDLVLNGTIHGKILNLNNYGFGPFQVVENLGLGTYKLKKLEGEVDLLHVNGKFLK